MGIDRKNIDDKYKWKIDLMYSSKESIDKDIENIKSYINEIKQYKGKLSQSKENLYEALNIYEKASQLLQNLYVYTHMKQHEDTRINENQAMATKTDMLSTELSTASSYMVPEIIAIDESKLKEYLEDEKLYLMYTGNQDPGGFENLRQVQCIAVSEDGINFTKYENNPVIDSTKLPKEAIIQDFRDPKVYKKGDKYYSVIGSRNLDDSGQILLYSSDDLLNWNYEGNILQSNNEFAKMWECPDLFELDNKDILIMSPQFLEPRGNKYWNLHSSSYMIGNLDYKNNKYNLEKVEEIDYGFDFYAPQTLIDNKGRRIMIAWMQMWDRKFPTNELGHNWAGCMTIPRELKLVDDKLYQLPVEELKVLRKNEVSYKDINIKDNKSLEGIKGQCIELELEVDMKNSNEFEILLMKGNNQETSIKYNKIDELLVFDRSKNGKALGGGEKEVRTYRQTEANLIDNKLKLNIFIDRMSVEIFINDGIKTMSSTVYPDKDSDNIEFYCDKEAILDIKKWDMEVK